jgi:hypothetical protein
MKKWGWVATVVGLAVCASVGSSAWGQTRQATEQGYVITGQYTVADWGKYLELPFAVPAGTTAIKVKYSYAADDNKTAVLEIGVYDPEKFRGWSSTAKKEFTIARDLARTTDSYLAGAIPAGEWRVELGVASVSKATEKAAKLVGQDVPSRSSVVTYRVEIELSREPGGEVFVMPPKKDVVIKSQPGWYKGDLHCHSTHSDGEFSYPAVLDFAHDQGLDFIATAEHDTISHFQYLPEMQQRLPDMLILYGIEYTSYLGHANVYNYDRMFDFHATNPGYDLNPVLDLIHAGGGYFSPNHPAAFLGIGLPFEITAVDWSKVDFYEVVNGRMRILGFIPNPINVKAQRDWDAMLQKGLRITAIGGSDDHSAGQHESPISTPVGTPTTVVWAPELSTRGILDGLKAGHVYVLPRGPKSGLKIEFTAEGNGKSVMMGDAIAAQEIAFKVKVEGAAGKTLRIVENGRARLVPITSGRFEHTFSRRPQSSGYVRLEVRAGSFPQLIANPIYYRLPGNP